MGVAVDEDVHRRRVAEVDDLVSGQIGNVCPTDLPLDAIPRHDDTPPLRPHVAVQEMTPPPTTTVFMPSPLLFVRQGASMDVLRLQ